MTDAERTQFCKAKTAEVAERLGRFVDGELKRLGCSKASVVFAAGALLGTAISLAAVLDESAEDTCRMLAAAQEMSDLLSRLFPGFPKGGGFIMDPSSHN